MTEANLTERMLDRFHLDVERVDNKIYFNLRAKDGGYALSRAPVDVTELFPDKGALLPEAMPSVEGDRVVLPFSPPFTIHAEEVIRKIFEALAALKAAAARENA